MGQEILRVPQCLILLIMDAISLLILTVDQDRSVTGVMKTVRSQGLESIVDMIWTAQASLMVGTLIRTAVQNTGTALEELDSTSCAQMVSCMSLPRFSVTMRNEYHVEVGLNVTSVRMGVPKILISPTVIQKLYQIDN